MEGVVIPVETEKVTPTGQLRFFFREARRRLWVSRRTSFIAVCLIAISLVIVGSFLLVSENLARAIDRWQGRSKMSIYLQPDVTPEAIRAIDAVLAQQADLKKRKFVSKEAALEKFKTFFTDLSVVVNDLGDNPFPPSYEIDVSATAVRTPAFNKQVAAVQRMPGVDEVQFDWDWIEKLRRVVNLINMIGIFAGGILALAAAFTIANVTRFTMVLYKEEMEIMRLVGATETTIRAPFLVEGVLLGTAGGILAVAILFGGFVAGREIVGPTNALLLQFLFSTFLPWPKVIAIVAGGTASGLIGSWLAAREKVDETGVPK